MGKVGKVNFVPAPDKVLIREVKKKTTESGLIKQEDTGAVTAVGTVFASSVDWVEPGDSVVYNINAALLIEIPDGKFLLASDSALLGKLDK